MKGNLHKNCLFYFSFLILVIYVNCVSLQTNNTNIKNQDNLRQVYINRTGTFIQNVSRKADIISSTPKSELTDSEVFDLIKHTPKTTTLSADLSSAATSTTHKPSALELDVIEKPQKYVHPNSKFNLPTGGIAALICTTVALSFYLSVMMWKRIVMNAYQNREILLNDEDIGDINDEDMRHFELKFLDKDGRVVESANGTV